MKWWLCLLYAALIACAGAAPAAEEGDFPFDGELILDADPIPGSKRVPFMEIDEGGKIVLEMWCNRVEGQLAVAGDTITVMTGAPADRDCSPERAEADAALLTALQGVTNWRREDDFVLLTGPTTLRFRIPTN